jgi:hypothetical protein
VEISAQISLGGPTLVARGAYAKIFSLPKTDVEGDEVIARVISRRAVVGKVIDSEYQKIQSQVAMMKFIQGLPCLRESIHAER